MICSSLNLLRFKSGHFPVVRIPAARGGEARAHVTFLVAIRGIGGRRPSDHRRVLDGIFWIARTGAPWRDLPEEFGKWSPVHHQFRRWTLAGLWETILEVLNASEAVPDSVQMIDSAIVRARSPLS